MSRRSSISAAASAVRRNVSIMRTQTPRGGRESPQSKHPTCRRTRLCRLRAESACARSCRWHPERAVLGLRRVRQRCLARERGTRLVVREHVHEVERMRRRRNVGQVELRHLGDGVQDRVELAAQALELLLRQRETRELRNVEHLVSRNRHLSDPPKTTAGGAACRAARRDSTEGALLWQPTNAEREARAPSGKRSGRGKKDGPFR